MVELSMGQGVSASWDRHREDFRRGSAYGIDGDPGDAHRPEEGEDVGVVDDAVDHRGGDGLVSEDAAPAGERQVAGEDQRGVFVAGGDELEEQVRGVLLEGEVADLVDDDQPVAAQPGELLGSRPARWASVRRVTQSVAVANSTRCPCRAAAIPARWRGGSSRCRAGRAARRCGPRSGTPPRPGRRSGCGWRVGRRSRSPPASWPRRTRRRGSAVGHRRRCGR